MTTKTAELLKVNPENIPEELKARAQWVVWEGVNKPDGKIDKVPHNPLTGERASSNDPRTWVTFERAFAEYQVNTRWAGIAYAFAEDDPYAGIDLDDGAEQAKWIERLDSYAEHSPSGTGVHIIIRGRMPEHARRRHGDYEAYSASQFFTFTGHRVDGAPAVVNERQEVLDAFIATELGYKNHGERTTLSVYHSIRVPTDQLLTKALAAKNGDEFRQLWDGKWESITPSQSEADASLCRRLAFWTGPDPEWIDDLFRESGLYREKWDRADYRDRTIALALDDLTDWYRWQSHGFGNNGRCDTPEQPIPNISQHDFLAYMPEHKYIFRPSRELWPAASVNNRLPPIQVGTTDNGEPVTIRASKWLDKHQAVEQMTWAPGEPELIEGRLVSQGGWIEQPGCTVFNLYLPPTLELGNPDQARPWLEHLSVVYPDEADHIIQWLAHRVQAPGLKINHGIVLGGEQGIGKDTILEPVKQAIGPWNFAEITPTQLLGRFNPFVQSVIMRISEARDLGDLDRYSFYEHLKSYMAAPPDVILCDQKYVREYSVFNVSGVIITTNYLTSGMYLPPDDRRHYVAWSEKKRNDFSDGYWTKLYQWYESGGRGHVAAYLAKLDLSEFDPKAPPPKTRAFWDIVDANRAPEDAELADVLESRFWPEAITLTEMADHAPPDLGDWLSDRRNSRQVPHRMESVGYVRVRNEATKDGRWKIGGKNQVVYAKKDLPLRDRIAAVQQLSTMYRKTSP